MISDFKPQIEVGSEYKASDGETYRVTDFLCNLGNLPDTVVFVSTKDPEKEFEAGSEEWNSKNFQKIDSSAWSEPEVLKESGETSDEPSNSGTHGQQTDTDSQEPQHSSVVTPEGTFSPDPKINELAGLLNAGPSQFNQKYFPTDENLPENNIVDKDAEVAFQETLDNIEKQRENGRSLKGSVGKINEFLWLCAGADRDLLRTCATDWAKKAGVGGTILGTAVLAACSGGYAAYTVFGSAWWALLVGLIWSLVIFNLDRYLVNSMYSDGTAKITKEEWISATPRIVIALFIGIIISAPIEMRIFDGKIQKYLQQQQKITLNEESAKSKDNVLSLWSERIQKLDKQDIPRLQNKEEKEHRDYQQEIDGSGGSGKVGHGDIAKAKLNNWNQTKEELNKRECERDSLQVLYEKRLISVTSTLAHNDSITNEFSTRLKVMLIITGAHYKDDIENYSITSNKSSDLISKDDDNNIGGTLEIASSFWPTNSLFWVRLLIMLFFMTIEIMPVLAKMMQENGQYDKILILESNTREQLERIKEYNNLNITIVGPLAPYIQAIIGHDIKEDRNNYEGDNVLIKTDIRRENKDETEQDNQEIYRYARKKAKEYIMQQIDAIFGGTQSSKSTPTSSVAQSTIASDASKDPSDKAANI